MKVIFHHKDDRLFAEIASETRIIDEPSNSLEILGELYYQNVDGVILHRHHLSPEFFDLKSGAAGEILQKFSNFRMRLAIIGDFGQETSESLKSFIRECNQKGDIIFVDSTQESIRLFSEG